MDNMLSFIDRLNAAIAQRERELGERILKKDLAAAAGVTSSAVTLWFKGVEDGGTNELKAASILGLSKYLKVRVEWLRANDGPMRTSNTPAHQAPAPEQLLTDSLSREARKLVDLITAADREKTISKETFNAFALILGKTASDHSNVADQTTKRSIERAHTLIKSAQPKRKKGKGAA